MKFARFKRIDTKVAVGGSNAQALVTMGADSTTELGDHNPNY
jgi:hypothetical protein